jgi:death-on-curing protein
MSCSKTGALGFALAQGHPFVDGNKRVAHAAMATFLLLNGAEIGATVDERGSVAAQVLHNAVQEVHQ